MLVNTHTIWSVEPHSGDSPTAFDTLLRTLRNARAELNLPVAKQLGTEYSYCTLRYNKDFERHAGVVGGSLLYILDGYPTKDPYVVIRKIRDKVTAHSLDIGEVLFATGLPTVRVAAYLFGRLPKWVNLLTLAILAETMSMDLEYNIVWAVDDIHGLYKASQAGEEAKLDAELEAALSNFPLDK